MQTEENKIIETRDEKNTLANKTFLNDKLNGGVTEYSQDGKPKHLFEYKDGKLDGTSIIYTDTGDLAQEMHYKNGLLHGTSKFYSKGGLHMEINYLNGKMHGDMILYAENGNIRQVLPYEEGLQHGDFVRYDPNTEEILETGTYVKGKKQGVAHIFFPNSRGKIYEEAFYKDNLLEGYRKRYHPGTDKISEICEFKAGKPLADPVTFTKNGKVKKEAAQGKLSLWQRILRFFKII